MPTPSHMPDEFVFVFGDQHEYRQPLESTYRLYPASYFVQNERRALSELSQGVGQVLALYIRSVCTHASSSSLLLLMMAFRALVHPSPRAHWQACMVSPSRLCVHELLSLFSRVVSSQHKIYQDLVAHIGYSVPHSFEAEIIAQIDVNELHSIFAIHRKFISPGHFVEHGTSPIFPLTHEEVQQPPSFFGIRMPLFPFIISFFRADLGTFGDNQIWSNALNVLHPAFLAEW
jgi:hypothetical protein